MTVLLIDSCCGIHSYAMEVAKAVQDMHLCVAGLMGGSHT